MKESNILTKSQLKALIAPRTRQVFEAIQKKPSITVPELQNQLDYPSKTIYYQVKKLLNVNLIKVSRDESRAESYQTTSSNFLIPDEYVDDEYEALAAKAAVANLKQMQRLILESTKASTDDKNIMSFRSTVTLQLSLSKEEVRELTEQIEAIIKPYAKKEPSPDSKKVNLLLNIVSSKN